MVSKSSPEVMRVGVVPKLVDDRGSRPRSVWPPSELAVCASPAAPLGLRIDFKVDVDCTWLPFCISRSDSVLFPPIFVHKEGSEAHREAPQMRLVAKQSTNKRTQISNCDSCLHHKISAFCNSAEKFVAAQESDHPMNVAC